MTKIKTYIDSGVLISAYQGIDEVASKAIECLDAENRQFISSVFVKLEVDEFITTEKSTKPLHRVTEVKVISITD